MLAGVTSELSDEPVSLDDGERVTLSLWTADAVVLYNWLMSVDIEAVPHEHRGELQALTDLLTALTEHVEGVSASMIDNACERVARDMDW
jgi:hypothetical protein